MAPLRVAMPVGVAECGMPPVQFSHFSGAGRLRRIFPTVWPRIGAPIRPAGPPLVSAG